MGFMSNKFSCPTYFFACLAFIAAIFPLVSTTLFHAHCSLSQPAFTNFYKKTTGFTSWIFAGLTLTLSGRDFSRLTVTCLKPSVFRNGF